MGDERTDKHDDDAKARAAIVQTLKSRGQKARFVTELTATLSRAAVSAESLERVLRGLAFEGVVMLRDHFCADPHLNGVDLRIAALVSDNAGPDAQMHAIQAIDAAWDKWLAEYLSNHRCS